VAFSYKDKEKDYFEKLEGQEFKPGDEYLGILDNIKSTESELDGVGEFKGTYTESINKAVADYLGRDKFNFNPDNSATYQQLRDQYLKGGKVAMQDTMANGAMLSGGLNNSASQVAGQQVYQNYVKGAADVIPTLEQQAYERYKDEGNQMLANIDLMKGMDDDAYQKYLDGINQIYSKLNYLNGRLNTEANMDASRLDFEQGKYNALLSAAQNGMQYQDNKEWREKEYDYNKGRDDKSDAQTALNNILSLASYGFKVKVTPELEKMGITQKALDDYVYRINASASSVSQGGGSGKDYNEEEETEDKYSDVTYTNSELVEMQNSREFEALHDYLSEKSSSLEALYNKGDDYGLTKDLIDFYQQGKEIRTREQLRGLLFEYGIKDIKGNQEKVDSIIDATYTEDEFYAFANRDSQYNTYVEYLNQYLKYLKI